MSGDGWPPLLVNIEGGGWTLVLSPQTGGVIVACRYQGRDILRPATEKWHRAFDPMQSACFPLFPYSNRIANGDFEFEGVRHHIEQNFAGIKHPLHGTAWFECWEVGAQSDNSCELIYTQAPEKNAWPFAFEARQSFSLEDGVLTMDLSIKNTGDVSMPAGLGLHPYFSKQDAAHLQFEAEGVWLSDDECLPQTWSKTLPKWDFSDGLAVADVDLDHCFTGWNGRASLSWDAYVLEIHSDAVMGHAIVYTGEADSFCFEPVSHMNNAVNWMDEVDTGLRILGTGETLTSTTKLIIKK